MANSAANARQVGTLLGIPLQQCGAKVKPILSTRDVSYVADGLQPRIAARAQLPTIWLSDAAPDIVTWVKIKDAIAACGMHVARIKHHPWYGLQFTTPTYCVGAAFDMKRVASDAWHMPRSMEDRLVNLYAARQLATVSPVFSDSPNPITLWLMPDWLRHVKEPSVFMQEAHNRGFLVRDFRDHPHYVEDNQ